MRHLLPLLALAAAACGNLNDKVDEVEVNDRGDNAIVGGSNAAEGQFAHQVSLQTRSGFHYCGASLIADGWVLTAAHCVDDPASQMRVRIGTTRSNSGGQLFNVTRKIRHPSYNANTMDNDVALLELSTSTGSLTTVPLANDAADDGISAAGQMATVSGWGALSESGSSPTALQYVEVPLLTNSSCNVSYNGDITARMVCAGYAQGGQDSCQGDSGGPMVVDNGGSWVQNGVVSWGEGCARPGKPGVYARVSQFESWISGYVTNAVFTSGGGVGPGPGPEPEPEPTTEIFVDGETTISSSLSAGEVEVYTLVVPEAQTITVSTTGSTDTYGTLLSGSSILAQDDDSGADTNFQITADVAAGTYELKVRGYSTSTTGAFNLVVSGIDTDQQPEPDPEPEPEPEPVFLAEVDLQGARNSTQSFTLEVPAGQSVAEFLITGGTGDADMYVRYGSAPTTGNYDCRPYRNGNEETCSFANPQAGTWHVMLRGYSAYTGVTLAGSFE